MPQPMPESYKQALAELEKLIAELEGDQVDIDHLAEKVERAAILLKHCREKLSRTELRVKEIVGSLDEPGSVTVEKQVSVRPDTQQLAPDELPF